MYVNISVYSGGYIWGGGRLLKRGMHETKSTSGPVVWDCGKKIDICQNIAQRIFDISPIRVHGGEGRPVVKGRGKPP